MSRRRFAVVLLTLALACATAAGQSLDKPQAIDAFFATYYEAGLFNGTALVAENGKVILRKGYGSADFEWQIPNTPDTKFRLGSITKQFTSALILQLVNERKLSTDAKLADVLRTIVKRQAAGSLSNICSRTPPAFPAIPGCRIS